MNILIIGGAGFIGSNLALKLLSKKHIITVLDNLSPQVHGSNPEFTSPSYISIKNKVSFIKGSITSRKDLKTAILNQEIIINLAAETGTGQSMYKIEQYTSVNVNGTSILLDILVNTKHTIRKFIVASSRAIYGEGKYLSENLDFIYPSHRRDDLMRIGEFNVQYNGLSGLLKPIATDETSKIHPTSVYGITKQTQEQLVMTVCPKIGIAPVAFRYQNIYGPQQSLVNPYTGILSIFSTLIKTNQQINIFEDGNQSRDFVYIDDAIEATILGIEKESADNEVFNVGTSIPVNVNTVVNELINNYKKEVPINISGNYRIADIRHNFADLTKIKKHLNFTPKVNFKDGVHTFCQWVNNQQFDSRKYEKSLREMRQKGLFK